MPHDLQTTRGRVFFGIGLVILPVFWIWWITPRHFSRRQIQAAWVWTIAYCLIAVLAWWTLPVFHERVANLRWNYPAVSFQVGVVLWLWLLFRIGGVWQVVMSLLMCIDVGGLLWGMAASVFDKLDPSPIVLLDIVIPAAAHLLLDPAKALRKRLIERLDRHLENEARQKRVDGPNAPKS